MQPPCGCAHHGQTAVLTAQERAQRVGLEVPAHIPGRHLLEPLPLPDGGTIDQDVKPAKVLQGPPHQPTHGVLIGQIRPQGQGLDAPARKPATAASASRSAVR